MSRNRSIIRGFCCDDKNYEKKTQVETVSVPAETQTDQFWNMSLVLPLHQSAQKKKRQRMYV